MNKLNSILWIIIISLTFVSCGDDLPIDQPEPETGDFTNGYFVANEGPFGNGTGTITFIGDDETVVQNVYKTVNSEDLGNIVQSMTIHNSTAFIVVNNSHKVIIANRHSMEKITIIEGDDIKNPRNLVVVGNKAYVSNWGNTSVATDDFIAVIDLDSNTVTSTISVGEGPEDMLVVNDKIYVNLQGGFNQNNKVEVIDTTTDTISTTITVGDVPNSLVKDNNGAVWVLCGGNPAPWTGATFVETNGELIKIENDMVSQTFEFSLTDHPNHLTINDDNLIYNLGGQVYATANTATDLNTTALNGLDGFHYTIKAHNGLLYTTNAGDFASEGSLTVFDLSDNSEVNTFTTGIIPGSIVF